MDLTLWTYEGPPHVGAMRVVTGMRDIHYVLHAPQGDTYADLLFTMIERLPRRPPVTYTTFQAKDLGGDTAVLYQDALRRAYERFRPQAILAGASCTAELLQDDPRGLSLAADLPVPIIPVELPAYQRKENWGAGETFYQLVRSLVPREAERPAPDAPPRCNILGPTALGFRHRDDVPEVRRLLDILGVEVNVVAPLGASPLDLTTLGDAHFNVVLYPETADAAARWLERELGQPRVESIPIGVGGVRRFVTEVCETAGLAVAPALERIEGRSRLPWYSLSVDSTYLTGKRVFVFGDATHAVGVARLCRDELGFEVVGLGTYQREFARGVRKLAKELGVQPLITDDYLEVEAAVADLEPEMVLGTQMERHISKKLGLPCAVISAPVHVQDYPARYSPLMGLEGANVLFDTLVHPLVMGLEEHLLELFRDDFEFGDGALPSHLAAEAPGRSRGGTPARSAAEGDRTSPGPEPPSRNGDGPPPDEPRWEPEAERELAKIPFFVRGKARRNTERFAREQGLVLISLDTLYEAKAHFGGK